MFSEARLLTEAHHTIARPLTSDLASVPQAFPVLVGDMDNSGSLNAQVIHQLGPGLRSKMAIQVSGSQVSCSPRLPEHPATLYTLLPRPLQTQQSKFVNWQVDGEYRGSDFTAAVTLGNPDVLVGSGKRHGAWRESGLSRSFPGESIPCSRTRFLPSRNGQGQE